MRRDTLKEAIEDSMFVVPAAMLVGGIVLSQVTLVLDDQLEPWFDELPGWSRTTVEGARELLGTIASATLTFAGVAISILLLLVQLAATQYSPRVIYGFIRDDFTKRVIGLVAATFAYSLLVLRVVRSADAGEADAVTPHLSVIVATVLGLATVLAIVALIDHAARSVRVGELVARITRDTKRQIRALHDETRPEGFEEIPDGEDLVPDAPGHQVHAPSDGWVQALEEDKILDAMEDGTTMRLDVRIGSFAPEGAPLATFWPVPRDPDAVDETFISALKMGNSRTLQEDVAFGVRQLVDIALRALSPSVNDPTTAEESIQHISAILRAVVRTGLPADASRDGRGRVILRPHQRNFEGLVALAFDQLRDAAAGKPSVLITIVRALSAIGDVAIEQERDDLLPPLTRQARLLLDQTAAIHVDDDRSRVDDAARGLLQSLPAA
jgi:uncharacterized membrane protein